MTALLAAFMFGTFWWWGFSLLWLVLIIVALDKESGVALFFEFVIYFAFLQWISKVNIFQFILEHPAKTLLYVGTYIAIGILWSFIKWYLKVSDHADKLKEEKVSFLKEKFASNQKRGVDVPKDFPKNIDSINYKTGIPDKDKEEWHSKIRFGLPKAAESKSLIATWITYWPFSVVWSFLNDFIHRIIKRVVNELQKIYESITKRALRDVV